MRHTKCRTISTNEPDKLRIGEREPEVCALGVPALASVLREGVVLRRESGCLVPCGWERWREGWPCRVLFTLCNAFHLLQVIYSEFDLSCLIFSKVTFKIS